MHYLGKKVEHDSPDFKLLFNNYFPTLCLFSEGILKDGDSAKDVVQDVFIKLLGSDTTFENEKAIKAYLYVLTKNSSLDSIKKNQNNSQAIREELLSYSENDFLANIVREETFRLLDIAIQELGTQSQNIIKLTMNQLSNQEIAEELDISVNTVKTLKLRAYQRLRKLLGAQFMVLLLTELF